MIRHTGRPAAAALLLLGLLLGFPCGTAQARDFTAADFDDKTSGAAEFADSDAGGPDEWEVANLKPGDTLKLRAEPNAKAKVVATFASGIRLRNLGCRTLGDTRWCRVSRAGTLGDTTTVADAHAEIRGFVAGRFLREPSGPAPATPAPAQTAAPADKK